MRTLFLLAAALIAAAAAAFAPPALAGDGGGKTPGEGRRGKAAVKRLLAKLDTDRDGRISSAEAAAAPRLAKRFAKIDRDGDGYITRAELKACRKAKRDARRGEGRRGKRGAA